MDLLAELVSSRARAAVFRMLFGREGTPLYLREIQGKTNFAVGTIQQELRKLVRLKLLTRERSGRRVYFEANRAHPLYPEIHNMVMKTRTRQPAMRR